MTDETTGDGRIEKHAESGSATRAGTATVLRVFAESLDDADDGTRFAFDIHIEEVPDDD